MSDKQRISLNPEPPVAGQNVQISYDFEGLPITQVTVRVFFGGSDPGTDYTIDPNHPATVPVPADATSIVVEDLTGPSPDKASPVTSGAPANV